MMILFEPSKKKIPFGVSYPKGYLKNTYKLIRLLSCTYLLCGLPNTSSKNFSSTSLPSAIF